MITFAYQNRAITNDYLMAYYAQKHNNHADSQSLRITPFLLRKLSDRKIKMTCNPKMLSRELAHLVTTG